MKGLSIFLCFCAVPAAAQTVMPDRTIRANSIIVAADLTVHAAETNTGFSRIEDVVGQEARVVLYPGRAIRIDDVGPPAVVTRNQIVRVAFSDNGLSILTEGRALERGAIGDLIRIMNLSSRATVSGFVRADGTVQVRP